MRFARLILGDDDDPPLGEDGSAAGQAASPSIHARLDLAVGIRLRRQRRSSEARPYLRAASDGFGALGAAPWADRARQELRASGEAGRHQAPHHQDDLTPQELQIGLLAADGLSNREIGAAMFLSHRTVGTHLYRAFAKLGITSRVKLREALAGRGHVVGAE